MDGAKHVASVVFVASEQCPQSVLNAPHAATHAAASAPHAATHAATLAPHATFAPLAPHAA
jgi:hypothetical protein